MHGAGLRGTGCTRCEVGSVLTHCWRESLMQYKRLAQRSWFRSGELLQPDSEQGDSVAGFNKVGQCGCPLLC
jgi:hypothetical protein